MEKQVSRLSRIRDYLANNEGGHRGCDVAKALGITTHQALVGLRYEWTRGHVERTKQGTYHVYAAKQEGTQ
jgi:hypothetical protein